MEEREIEYIQRDETFEVRGDTITVQSNVPCCTFCGAELLDVESGDETLRKVYAEYRKKHDLLSSEQIRVIRKKYGLSHRTLAKLLGWGPITTQRYERGALQDEAHDSILREMRDNPAFIFDQYRKNAARLSLDERYRLEKTLSAIMQANGAQLLIRAFETEESISYARSPVDHGRRAFDFGRLKEIVSIIASTVELLDGQKLGKLLWLIDFAGFALNGRALTGLAYLRRPNGPAPVRAHTVLALLEESRVIRIEFKDALEVIRSQDPPSPPLSLEQDERALPCVISMLFGHMSGIELSKASHKEPIWEETEDGALLPYAKAGSVEMLRPVLEFYGNTEYSPGGGTPGT